jgi:disulfide bond formation protein DsbB
LRVNLTPKFFLLFICAICLIVLGLAYAMEYAFDLKACMLCLYQRYVFMAIVMGCLAGVVLRKQRPQKTIVLVVGLMFLLNAGIAAYQVMVEQKIIEPPTVCQAPVIKAKTVDELRAQLRMVKPVPCDEVLWSMFGISMAGYNFILCLTLAGVCGVMWWRFAKQRRGRRA